MITSGGTVLGFGRLEPYTAPRWPNTSGAKQLHLDLTVDDLDAATQRCKELGATVPDHQPSDRWRVLLDPAGHPLCLTTGG